MSILPEIISFKSQHQPMSNKAQWTQSEQLLMVCIIITSAKLFAPRLQRCEGVREKVRWCVLALSHCLGAVSLSPTLGIMNSSHSSCSWRWIPAAATGLLGSTPPHLLPLFVLRCPRELRASYLISATANLISLPLAPREKFWGWISAARLREQREGN